jgi:hypothetical protein
MGTALGRAIPIPEKEETQKRGDNDPSVQVNAYGKRE